MAIITRQRQIFEWQELEILGDLERFRLVQEHMPDERLMQHLERQRDRGRDDYPVRAMWNSVLAGIIYQHPSIESLRRELLRNNQLRRMCGFNEDKMPSPWAYSRFLVNLFAHQDLIDEIFESLATQCYELLPGFGKHLALDGKAINSYARRASEQQKKDGRRDLDADYGAKSYKGKHKDGTLWEKTISWLGYKLHLLVDTDYELPVAYELTPASHAEITQAHYLLSDLKTRRPQVLDTCQFFSADRGYDDSKLLTRLWDEHGIKPIIDIIDCWKSGEQTRLFEGRDNIVYDYRGTVYCCCPKELKQREMAYAGFEKKRGTLKYRCPAEHYGLKCQGKEECPIKGSIRIRIEENRRYFLPLPRSSYRFKDYYKKRTAVERVNSRLDVSFGFEHHFIRGLKKMRFRCSLAICVMLAMAIGRVKEKRPDLLRSLVQSA